MNSTTRAVLVGAAVALLLVLVLGPALMMTMMMGMGGMMDGGMMGDGVMGQPGMMMGGGWLMMAFWLLIIAGIVLLLIWALRRSAEGATGTDQEIPLTILQRRYARGEIGPEEYERIRTQLLREGGQG